MKSHLLIFLFAFSLFFTFACAQESKEKAIKQIESTDAVDLLKSDSSIIVLDVRTPEEFNAGHVKDAINIDITQPDAFSKIDNLKTSDKYIVYCRTKNRSKTAVDYMTQKGFNHVYHIMDGYVGWDRKNLPLEK